MYTAVHDEIECVSLQCDTTFDDSQYIISTPTAPGAKRQSNAPIHIIILCFIELLAGRREEGRMAPLVSSVKKALALQLACTLA